MKLIKIITHPYIIVVSFLSIMISGQHLGGFYLLYILLALPHFEIHSLLAIAGSLLLIINYNRFKNSKRLFQKSIINIISLLMLILSLFLFFYNDREHYNFATFHQIVPQITLSFFAIIAVTTITVDINSIYSTSTKKSFNNLNI